VHINDRTRETSPGGSITISSNSARLQIARMDGREVCNDDDRRAARSELLAPNEVVTEAPEVSPDTADVTAWDEAPGSSGHRVKKVEPEDEASVGKDLIEKGLRGPRIDLPS